jgi:hypothetical protein
VANHAQHLAGVSRQIVACRAERKVQGTDGRASVVWPANRRAMTNSIPV